MQIIQLNVGGFDNNYSYLLVGENNEAILIDPTGAKEVIEQAIKDNNLKLVMQLLTHDHFDHTELVDYFKDKGIPLKSFEDLKKENTFEIAKIKVRTLFTPGHTKDGVCFKIENNLFTGDTLFVAGIGTIDYGGNEKELQESLAFLSTLDKEIILWPGHNYGGAKSTLGQALENSHIKPSEEMLEQIKKKVKEYEKPFQ
jgi:glyoxylase-like metal-dependent hydrolase (beta-lactamase superfamily II)